MNDSRIALKNNTIISFGDGKNCQITGEIGRGASCIVYDAITVDSIGVPHRARVKECYPSTFPIPRDEKNQLIPAEHNQEKFDAAKKRFIDTYRRSAEIRNTFGLVNSTANPTEITSCNQTVYIKIELDEGIDYGKYQDPSLKSLFLHIRSLAGLIQKYHENGYLYLDIKPENIFILPETEEHIILFDFDSVLTPGELRADAGTALSYSIGFSPFEQSHGQLDKIGKHTDIYAIGALAFYKLFNRAATQQECKISSTYPFGEMLYADEKYNPKLYRAMDTFFKKTLSIAIAPRWHDMQPVIEQLDRLIQLSDIDEVYLLDSFQYDSACFVGRTEEMEEIADTLATNQLVFLSGIGGIGKTELAKQYAHKYRSQYDTVTFAVFEKNIETLVCDEILIHKITRDEEETDADYFERKIGILKQIATPRDLVIIDNFDVDSDEKLELLFRCPCKFIITTRMDFSDYNYRQIYVDRLRDLEDVLGLFYTYNHKDYQGEENTAVEKLVDFVDCHTMTVELIAKYLRNSEELPSDLYGKFLQREGSTNTGEQNVKQRKDFALRSKSVNDHLRILFDVSGFDPVQTEIIRSLSLLAGIRIEKSRFHALCAAEDGEKKLGLLIRDGWVEYSATSGKISLHQVIQDLVYKDLAPNAENCPRIVEGMGEYAGTESMNRTKENIRQKTLNIFMGRLSGNNLLYAKLCLKYGKEDKLDEAEKICLGFHKKKSFSILQEIYMEKIRIRFDSEQQINSISGLLDKATFYCRKVSEKPNHIVKEYIEIGCEVECLLSHLCSHLKGRLPETESIYLKLMDIFNAVIEKLPLTSYSARKKINFYQEIQSFFSGKYYGITYRGDKFSDLEKAYECQESIEQLMKNIPKIDTPKLFFGLTASQLALEYEKAGEYERTIEYYKKDLEKGYEIYREEYGEVYEDTMWRIASTYFKIGNVDKGIFSLEQVIKHNKKRNVDSCGVYIDLIRRLIKHKDFGKAEKYAKELISLEEPKALSGNHPRSLSYVLSAYYYLYLLEQDQNKVILLWKNCLKYYETLRNEEIREELYDFITEYLDKEEIDYETIVKVLDRIAGPYGVGEWIQKEIMQHSIEKYKKEDNFKKYHVIFLARLAELADVDSFKDLKNGRENCEKAQEYYDKYNLNDESIQNLIYKARVKLMMTDKKYDLEKIAETEKLCNYKLLAEQQISKYSYDEYEQERIWEDAALQYKNTDNYSMMAVCITQALKVSNPMEFGQFNYLYQKLMRDLLEAYITISDFNSAYSAITKLYDKIIEYLVNFDGSGDIMEDSLNDDAVDLNGIMKWFNNIAKYFAKISKFDDAVRTYLTVIYLALSPEIDPELLKFWDDAGKDIVQLCAIIDESLEQEIDDEMIDPLVASKEGILEYKDLCSVDASVYRSIVAKISEKYQYKEIDFKR